MQESSYERILRNTERQIEILQKICNHLWEAKDKPFPNRQPVGSTEKSNDWDAAYFELDDLLCEDNGFLERYSEKAVLCALNYALVCRTWAHRQPADSEELFTHSEAADEMMEIMGAHMICPHLPFDIEVPCSLYGISKAEQPDEKAGDEVTAGSE